MGASKQKLLLIAIIIIACFFRFYNLNWDQGYHLHPDERFLTMVGNSMQIPNSFTHYLDASTSPMNPVNIGYPFYVYGTSPLVLNKLIAVGLGTDTYGDFTIQGRFLSGFFDILTLVFLIKLLALLCKKRHLPTAIVPLGAFFYAVSVLPIQLSHYFAVDTFLSFFVLTSFYTLLKYCYEGKVRFLVLSGLLIGFAVAAKVSAVYILPLHALILLWSRGMLHQKFFSKQFLGRMALFGVCFYVALHLAGPYYFAEGALINPMPNPTFLANIATLKSYESITFPPSVQWYSTTPIIFPLYNLAFFGVGVGYFILLVAGIFFLVKKYRYPELIILLIWAGLFFLYQSTQLVKTMRYFIFLYPFFAFFATVGFVSIFGKTKVWIQGIVIALVLIWPLSFMSIYVQPMTRVAATNWIGDNIPQGSLMLSELWDDGLPLPLPNKYYPGEQLPVFDLDTPEKWQRMDGLLERGDYLVLSSNRGWGSIPKVPDHYPQMSVFYADLFAGKLPYKKIQEFTSYPSLTYLGIPLTFPDGSADEAFSVYDHPQVMIFQHVR
ncbi:MAG: glycosyltransferase family 39 protein [Patescibacteria group bacterium]